LVYQQVYDPIAGSLALSTLVAIIPIVVLFVLLAGVRVAAQWASLATLLAALVIAVVVYGMPIPLALNSTLLGICVGLFLIVWIVITPRFRTTNTREFRFSTRLPVTGIPRLRLSPSA
jgi:lactate permease